MAVAKQANRIAGVLASLDTPSVAEYAISTLSFLDKVREALAAARGSG